jgi:histidinol-phosphate/aromatic aminotransferase/cobyric acid decarboxylase-like protein
MGFESVDSQANFIFVKLGAQAVGFTEACRNNGVAVGRAFPPYGATHSRISLGTMSEMTQAIEIFRKILSTSKGGH